jgi:hypothetical protein
LPRSAPAATRRCSESSIVIPDVQLHISGCAFGRQLLT